MGLYFDQQTEQLKARRVVPPPDDVDQRAPDAPLIVPFKEGWAVQPPQPPAFRARLRHSALFPWDADFNDNASKLFVPGPQGFENQAWQPPAPARASRPALLFAATSRGDEGTQAPFVPPWLFASPLQTFPALQSDVRSATPSYNAGPQVGAIKSMPNIVNPTVLKAAPGTLFAINVVAAGSGGGALYDAATLLGAVIQNQVCAIPTTATQPIVLDWPCQAGILLVPGTGQVLSAKWV